MRNLELSKNALPAWLGDDARLLGASEDPIGAALIAGRLLRGGPSSSARAELRRWLGEVIDPALADALGSTVADWVAEGLSWVEAWSAAEPSVAGALEVAFGSAPEEAERSAAASPGLPAGFPWALLARRDDVESLLVALGVAALETESEEIAFFEREAVARAAGLDRVLAELGGDLTGALRRAGAAPSGAFHLEVFAERGLTGSWLAALARARWSEAELRPALAEALGRIASSSGPTRLRARHGADRAPAMALPMSGGEVGLVEATLGKPGRAPILLLAEGAVVVQAAGLGEGESEPAGLIVRAESAEAFAAIESVALEPPGARQVERVPNALAFWVPLVDLPEGPRTLVVRLRKEGSAPVEERAPLELA